MYLLLYRIYCIYTKYEYVIILIKHLLYIEGIIMDKLSIDEAFEQLKRLKITTNKESVRRWLRQGTIKGIPPVSKKEGWKIPKESLEEFIQKRMPEDYITYVSDVSEGQPRFNTTNVVKEIEERIREEIWFTLTRKGIWEGYIEPTKTQIRECVKHRRYSKETEQKVWEACQRNKRGYSKPRIPYLLDAFMFDGERIPMDKKFESIEDQIIFPIIERVVTNFRHKGMSLLD